MTDAELFDQLVKKYGLGIRFEPKTKMTYEHWNNTYGHIHRYAEQLIGSARGIVKNLPPIYFDFIYNPKVNAWAFKDNDRYFIGITTGMRFMVEFVFFRMLADARMFSNIGNAAAEQNSFPPLINYSSDAQEMSKRKLYTGPPKDPIRFAYAVNLLVLV